MTYNLNYFRSQVRRVIDTAPTHVTITRDVWVSEVTVDGSGILKAVSYAVTYVAYLTTLRPRTYPLTQVTGDEYYRRTLLGYWFYGSRD